MLHAAVPREVWLQRVTAWRQGGRAQQTDVSLKPPSGTGSGPGPPVTAQGSVTGTARTCAQGSGQAVPESVSGEKALDLLGVDLGVLGAADRGAATHQSAPSSPADRYARPSSRWPRCGSRARASTSPCAGSQSRTARPPPRPRRRRTTARPRPSRAWPRGPPGGRGPPARRAARGRTGRRGPWVAGSARRWCRPPRRRSRRWPAAATRHGRPAGAGQSCAHLLVWSGADTTALVGCHLRRHDLGRPTWPATAAPQDSCGTQRDTDLQG